MHVIIGIDPHEASHTAVAISDREDLLGLLKIRSNRSQVEQLRTWATGYPTRTWAIEGAEGLGFLLAQQLVSVGERVVDVPATRAARPRVLATRKSNKNDPNDALSVAVTALRNRDLREVAAVGTSEVLRLLAKRNTDIGDQRTRLLCRLHALLPSSRQAGSSPESRHGDCAVAATARLGAIGHLGRAGWDRADEFGGRNGRSVEWPVRWWCAFRRPGVDHEPRHITAAICRGVQLVVTTARMSSWSVSCVGPPVW